MAYSILHNIFKWMFRLGVAFPTGIVIFAIHYAFMPVGAAFFFVGTDDLIEFIGYMREAYMTMPCAFFVGIFED